MDSNTEGVTSKGEASFNMSSNGGHRKNKSKGKQNEKKDVSTPGPSTTPFLGDTTQRKVEEPRDQTKYPRRGLQNKS